jgi:signal transduction histidine kinase
MSANTDSRQPFFTSPNFESFGMNSNGSLPAIGAELAYVQDSSGCYLDFSWQKAAAIGLQPEQVVGRTLEETFGPLDTAAYLRRVQRILESLVPERCQCVFRYGQKLFGFELTISPILPAEGTATSILVMGRHAKEVESEAGANAYPSLTIAPTGSLGAISSKKLLSQIARNIRRTLDLNTIWQQTVESLGQALGVSHCIICSYKPEDLHLQVVAEYRQMAVRSMLGQAIDVMHEPGYCQALETLAPVAIEKTENPQFQQSILLVATCHHDKPNGLICLQHCERGTSQPTYADSLFQPIPHLHQWMTEEIELVRDLADQIGTAIAHATLYRQLEEARQQAEEASRLKSEFLANTSHELRTPLNGMLGFLKLVLEGMADDPEEQAEFIQEAYRSGLHLLNIINDILDIAKIEAGKMELELGQVRLNELFHDVEDFTRTQADQKNLSLQIQLPPTADEIIVLGNYQRLLQVMLNLVGNAIKFTHEGGVTISADIIRKKTIFQNQILPGMVKVRVADTGIGVSLDKQDKLFQSFSQVDGSRTRQYGGTGLGLTISQKLVEAMGGAVNFYSMGEGLGSTVTFTVPLYQEPLMVLAPGDGE